MFTFITHRSKYFQFVSGLLLFAFLVGITPTPLQGVARAAETFVTSADAANLISNSALEVVDPSVASRPADWREGWQWGANVATYTYPVPVGEGAEFAHGNAMSVSYGAYDGDVLTGGDAKWSFAPVSVHPGHHYLYQDAYSANTPTYLVAEYFDSAGNHLSNAGFYRMRSTATDTWRVASASFIAPDGAASMTVYHQLNSAGTLVLDNPTLMEVAPPEAFDRGFVSLTFDDGFAEHFIDVAPMLDEAGYKGTFYVISHTTGFGVELNVSDGEGSDWIFAPVTVFANENYQFSHTYKSTATSTFFIRVIKDDGGVAYMQSDGGLVATEVAYATLPPASDWTPYTSEGLWIPPGSRSVSLRYALVASGTLDIMDVNMGAYRDFMTPEYVRALEEDQHEIGGHTQTHADLTTIALHDAEIEVRGGRQDLLLGGITSVDSFAYPLGGTNQEIEDIVRDAGYTSGRGTIEGFNAKNGDPYALMSTVVMSDTPMSEIQALIDKAVADRMWLILSFHQILPDTATGRTAYTISPERLASILDYLAQNNVPVSTVGEGVAMMEDAHDTNIVVPPPPPPAPTPTPAPAPTPSIGGWGSAEFDYWGCIDVTAKNYNRLANKDDGSCEFPVVTPIATTTIMPAIAATATTSTTSSPMLPDTGSVVPSATEGVVLGVATTTAPIKNFRSYLRPGARGAEVTLLQKRLQSSGHFNGPVTGYFGNLTFAAVKKFQLAHVLDAVGFVGPKTRSILNRGE